MRCCSPAEYLVSLEGAGGLAPLVDPMGGQLDCRSKHVSWRRVPEDIGWSLGVPPGQGRLRRRLGARPAGLGILRQAVTPARFAGLAC